MDNLFEKISSKLISTICKNVGLITIQTHEVTLFSIHDGTVSPPIYCTYDTIISKLSEYVSAPHREQLVQEMQLSHILAELDKSQNSDRIELKFTNFLDENFRFKISAAYYDDLRSSIVLAFMDETIHDREQLELIKKLRRTEDRFDFLRTHICDDFIEVNIQTGECSTIHANSSMVSKDIYKEQIEWFAKNIVAEEERAAYIADFDLDNLLMSLRKNDNFYTASYSLIYKDGRHDVLIVSALIQDSVESGYEYIISFAQDITVIKQQEAQNKRLIEIIQHDGLTGLYNRSAAEQLINKHLAEDLSHTPGTLAIIDIDYFKQVNDNYGHPMGDFILMQLAKALNEVFRSADILCRWGGDEFLVFLQNVSDEAIIEGRLERLRVKMMACNNRKRSLPITLSIGVAIASPRSTIDSLFKLADSSLYNVKNNGRNGFLIAEDK